MMKQLLCYKASAIEGFYELKYSRKALSRLENQKPNRAQQLKFKKDRERYNLIYEDGSGVKV